MKRLTSIVLALAMLLSMSSVFALPLSAEEIQEDASGAVTAVSDESPAIPEVTTVPEETTDPISEAT